MKKLTLILAVIAIAALSACRKEVTPSGSQAYGAVYDIKMSDWTTDDDSLSFSASFDVPELSNAIFDHGAVIVYLSFNDNIYEALPEVFGGFAYGAIHSPGAVTIDIHALDGYKMAPPQGEVYAKVVLINAQQLSLHPNVNLKDYNEVKRIFHIK